MNNRKIWLLVLAPCFVLYSSCSFDCGMAEQVDIDCSCSGSVISGREYFITDFESVGRNPKACNSHTHWNEGVPVASTQLKVDPTDQNAYLCLTISGNNGMGPMAWTGAGLVAPLTDCAEGVDLSDYDSLLFDIRMMPGSRLQGVTVGLRDTSSRETPERQVQTASFKLTAYWQTARIALDEFTTLKVNEIGVKVPLDLRIVTELTSQSIHDGTSPYAMDGVLEWDNFRFVKR